MKFEQM